jgi:site-specific recombinase XerD
MDYITDFLDYLKYYWGLSENTLKSYGWDLKIFSKWANERELRPQDAKIKDIDSFLIWTRKNGVSIRTANRKAYCLKSFFRWLLRNEIIDKNPLEFFRNIKSPKPLPRYLTNEEQEKLLKAARQGNGEAPWIRRRNHLMILLLLDSGLRINELCTLEMENVNLSEGILRVLGKGSKEREVILSDRVSRAIRPFLKSLERIKFNGDGVGPGLASRGITLQKLALQLGISRENAEKSVEGGNKRRLKEIRAFVREKIEPLPISFLFFNKNGKTLCQRHAFRIIKEIGQKAGIDGLHPHLLRHSFASNLRQRGADLLLMGDALGHSSVSTTQIYAHIGNDERRQELKRLVNLK